jgi:hypothetical protein
MGHAEAIVAAALILFGVETQLFIHAIKIGSLSMSNFKFQPMCLIFTFALMGPAAASISSQPTCTVDTDNNTASISITVDASSTLSSSAVVKLDGISVTGAHSISNSDRTVTAVNGQSCDNLTSGQITVVDGSVTHE